MAKNLRAKLPEGDTLVINDINKDATAQFVKEALPAGGVKIAESPREVAEQAVCLLPFISWSVVMSNDFPKSQMTKLGGYFGSFFYDIKPLKPIL